MARPRIEIDETKLKALMRLNPSLEDTAAFMECDPDTIINHIKRTYGIRFSEFRDKNMVHTRLTLIRTALKQAESGNTAMLIFCLKNLCDWRDRPPQEDFESLFSKMTRQELINFLKAKFPELEEKIVMQAPKQIEEGK